MTEECKEKKLEVFMEKLKLLVKEMQDDGDDYVLNYSKALDALIRWYFL